ncbi:hypothetical protein C0971_17165 [Bacillus methanolicus]|uniref:hypothetical protein n=1 Tax=Bacillus methanolicus TaxID=1471 RepID=UPI00200E8987|nr:hypothetical protein [Bacillus methanolicus]UQD53552.1 hypothetical protein C0971_17165 [Bacillus methanolicus]
MFKDLSQGAKTKNKADHLMPASETQLKLASILYYKVYGTELPDRKYNKQDIDYIIDQLNQILVNGEDTLNNEIVH